MSLLAVEGLFAGYGDIDILHDVGLALAPREILAIAGANGSGKSTLAKAVMGLLRRVRGSIRLDGRELLGLVPEARARAGIAYVPQVGNVFPSLGVEENLQVVEGVENRHMRIREIYALFPALRERRRVRAAGLSGGERQQLAFARALMPRPRLMILDEPTAALSPALTRQVFGLIRTLPDMGVAVLLVEQRAREALAVSDRGLILEGGRVALADRAERLLADPRLAELYLGHAAPAEGDTA